MNKVVKYTYRGVNQDITKSKHPVEYYFEGQHIRIMATTSQSTGSVANEKGNELVISIPSITINQTTNVIAYGEKTLSYENSSEIDQQINDGSLPIESNTQIIIGQTNTRTGIVLFTTDDNGMDCIWHLDGVLDGTYNLKLLYVRNLGFSSEHLIQAIYNYENENIQKVYWVDGVHQVRFINITHDSIEDNDPLIDIPSNNINFVGEVDFSQPTIADIVGGGTHTAGMIQYAYNLYRLNASQTKLSPLSELIPLDKGPAGGGEVNEIVGATPVVKIDDIDTSYTHIKVYAIKYTSYNQIPSINLIDERELDGAISITVYDDGSTISSLSLDEFLFLGSNPIIPKHIEAKDNILFPANIQTREFILPEEMDMRAYSFPINSSSTTIFDQDNSSLIVTGTYSVPIKHDTINKDFINNTYKRNSNTLGAEGKYISIDIRPQQAVLIEGNVEDHRYFKDQEIYRLGIEFYNKLGQKSLPQWIVDIRAPEGNLEGTYNTLYVELKPEFYTWLNSYNFESEDDKPVGYKILRADRTINDRTIICQGITSGMMLNIPTEEDSPSINISERHTRSLSNPKFPNILLRTQEKISPLQPNSHLQNMTFRDDDPNNEGNPGTQNPLTEIAHDSSERTVYAFQYSVMQQLYSPEILFDNLSFSSGLKIKVKGGALNTNNQVWGQIRNIETTTTEVEAKVTNALTPHAPGANTTSIQGNKNNLMTVGLIGNTNARNDEVSTEFLQWYRQFNDYKRSGNQFEEQIYGSPEITERGQGRTMYNNNSKYEYNDTFEGIQSNGNDAWDDDQLGTISLNSFGTKCLTLVLGSQSDIDPRNRRKIEDLYTLSQINNTKAALILEVIKDQETAVESIYKGNSYESKRRTDYLAIGEYKDIDTNFVRIYSPGDTYVQTFRFCRSAKTDTEIYQYNINQITEIIDFKVETTVDLKNRNDISLSTWDSRFQPQYNEYHQYNRVYSQQPTLVKSSDVDFTFRRVENFDTRIQASRTKIPNETIDSWTDLLENETMDLNGKYGPLNNIVSFEDNIYAFQDEAIALVSINPRVQVQGSDGIAIELGTGGILYDYNYLTTKSGSINKWGILPTKLGIYYYDALNRSLGRVPDYTKQFLSDIKGLHTYFNNNYNYDDIRIDNPVLRQGVTIGYDNHNYDVYLTLLQGDKSYTRIFNELQDEFVDKKLYLPSNYIYKGEKLLLVHPDNNKIYEQFKGEYNKFFDQYHPSYIILQVNPESDLTCVFNNIQYASEVYLNDIDQFDKTLTHIQTYNEYQDSGRIPLIVGRDSNLRRKFREWRANIPREGRNRMRNPWIYLKLEFDNESNYKMILHDIYLSYTI